MLFTNDSGWVRVPILQNGACESGILLFETAFVHDVVEALSLRILSAIGSSHRTSSDGGSSHLCNALFGAAVDISTGSSDVAIPLKERTGPVVDTTTQMVCTAFAVCGVCDEQT